LESEGFEVGVKKNLGQGVPQKAGPAPRGRNLAGVGSVDAGGRALKEKKTAGNASGVTEKEGSLRTRIGRRVSPFRW